MIFLKLLLRVSKSVSFLLAQLVDDLVWTCLCQIRNLNNRVLDLMVLIQG